MSKNQYKPGQNITVTATGTIVSGQGYIVGDMFGVAITSAESGEDYQLRVVGGFELAKDASVVGQLVNIYWDDGSKECSTSATTGFFLIGCSMTVDAAGTADKIMVRLAGNPVTAEA